MRDDSVSSNYRLSMAIVTGLAGALLLLVAATFAVTH